MSIYREHVTRFGARERLQEDPGEEPAHHLLRPLCARPDPPKRRTQIKTPSPRQHIPKGKPQRTEHTAKKPCRRGIWTGDDDRGGGWTEQSDGARPWGGREERPGGQELWFPLSLSLRYPSPPTAKNTGNALQGMACGEGEPEERERRGKHVRRQLTL